LIEKSGLRLILGKGVVLNAHQVKVFCPDGREELIDTDYILLATGSTPFCPELFGYDGKQVITSDEILSDTRLKESIIIVGGGVIGCEVGQFLNKAGTKVTIVEMQSHILPPEDEDTAKLLSRQLKKEKIKLITGNGVKSVKKSTDRVEVELADGKKIEAECLLVAIGRDPKYNRQELSSLGINFTKNGRIDVDAQMKTAVENIYAIGDLIDSYQLAHVAAKEGMIAVENILGNKMEIRYNAVPRCVYTNPQVASVGKTEQELKAAGDNYHIGSFHFRANGKAQAAGTPEGFVKIMTDEYDSIIGAAIVGAHATEMLQVLTTAVHFKLKASQLGEVIFPHPTMCEAIMEALHDLHGSSVHKA